MLRIAAVVCVGLLGCASTGQAQAIANPSTVTFTPSADHALVSAYELGYFAVGATDPVSSVPRTLAQLTADGANFSFPFPRLLFGTFEVKLRACAPAHGGGTACSAWAVADRQAAVSPFGATAVTLR